MKKQIITILAGVAVLGVLLLGGGCEPKNESLPPVEDQIEESELSTDPVTEIPNTEEPEATEPPINGKAVLCGKETWRYANCLYEYDGNGILVHDGGMGSLHMEYLVSFTLQDGKLKLGEFVRSSDNEDIDKALKEYKNISSFCTVGDFSLLEG